MGEITLDNASNNDTMCEELEALFASIDVPFSRVGNRIR